MLEVRNLTACYRDKIVLESISFSLLPRQLTCLLGPNGAGKSTLIKGMLGLIPLKQGTTLLEGQPLTQKRHRVAYVPQRNNVDWDYPVTVANVVMMGRTKQTGWFRPPSRYSYELVKNALQRVGMTAYTKTPIGELSGGQQQRVFLARALVQQADVFCFDEPFNGIDKQTEAVIFDIFSELKDQGKYLLVISHNLSDHVQQYDQFILLNKTLIAKGDQTQVLAQINIEKAYGKALPMIAA